MAETSKESKRPSKKRKDPRVESEYFEEVELTDPVTGQKIKYNAKITRYKSVTAKPVGKKGEGVMDEEVDLDLDSEI